MGAITNMRIVEVTGTFNHNNATFKKGHRYVMAEDIESQFRSVNGQYLGMSFPIETIYRKYEGQDLTDKKLMTWRTGGIGDMLFLSPVFRHLKKMYPSCTIRMASGCKAPLENLPEIDELYDMPFDAAQMEDVDYHLMFQGIIEGQSEASKRTHAVDMFFSYFSIDSTHFPAEDKKPRLCFTDEEMKWKEGMLSKIGVTEDDYLIGFQMETSAPLRNYPKEKMKKILDILAKEEKVKIFLIGTHQHDIIGQFYKGPNKNVILATDFNIRESIILATRYNLVVSPDSFIIQIAGALDKPLLGLYGPFPSDVRMKYFKNAIGMDPSVVCSPCYKHDFRPCVKGHPSPCFSQIKAEDVLQALNYLKFENTGTHFKFMDEFLKEPDLKEVEQYMLSADKGLSFFNGYYKNSNVIRIDSNTFTKPDISDLSLKFKRESYPFVLYMGPAGFLPQNRSTYDNIKGLIRPGGHVIVHMSHNGAEAFFEEVKRDVGTSGFIVLYSKFDPSLNSFTVVGRRPY